MLQATSGVGRDHGKNLDVLKAVRDGEASHLTTLFTSVAGFFASLFVAAGGLLYESISDVREQGSKSIVSGQETTVTKFYTAAGLSTSEVIALAALGMLLVGAAALVIANRRRQAESNRAYVELVELYFSLSRQIP
jgi:hypothetical protein